MSVLAYLCAMVRGWRQRRQWNRLTPRGRSIVRALDPGAVPSGSPPSNRS